MAIRNHNEIKTRPTHNIQSDLNQNYVKCVKKQIKSKEQRQQQQQRKNANWSMYRTQLNWTVQIEQKTNENRARANTCINQTMKRNRKYIALLRKIRTSLWFVRGNSEQIMRVATICKYVLNVFFRWKDVLIHPRVVVSRFFPLSVQSDFFLCNVMIRLLVLLVLLFILSFDYNLRSWFTLGLWSSCRMKLWVFFLSSSSYF